MCRRAVLHPALSHRSIPSGRAPVRPAAVPRPGERRRTCRPVRPATVGSARAGRCPRRSGSTRRRPGRAVPPAAGERTDGEPHRVDRAQPGVGHQEHEVGLESRAAGPRRRRREAWGERTPPALSTRPTSTEPRRPGQLLDQLGHGERAPPEHVGRHRGRHGHLVPRLRRADRRRGLAGRRAEHGRSRVRPGRRRGRRTGPACGRPRSGPPRERWRAGGRTPRSCRRRCRCRRPGRARRGAHVRLRRAWASSGGRAQRRQRARPAVHLLVGVGRREGDPQPAGAGRHGGRADGRHPQALGQQGGRRLERPLLAAQDRPGRSGSTVPRPARRTRARRGPGPPDPRGAAPARRPRASAGPRGRPGRRRRRPASARW